MFYRFIIKNIVQIFYSTNDEKYFDEDNLDNIRENINKNNLHGSLGWGYYF